MTRAAQPGPERSETREWTERVVPFTAGDGLPCNLIHVRGRETPRKGPVLLVHGAGVRANIFRPPVDTTFVDFLVERGYDVWLENWRASIDLPANPWTLDQAALFDHPEAVKTVVRETGKSSIQAVVHCQGSTSFMMSAVAGLLPQVTTIVSNAVSLHPVVPAFSRFKLRFALPLLRFLTPDLNPHWGVDAPTLAAKLVSLLVSLTHHECDNAVCKQVSFTYGSGFPALWRHENLNGETHEWLKQEFASVPLTFFSQMARCVENGSLVSVDPSGHLPADLAAAPPRTDARIALFAGDRNLCFLPDSQRHTFQYLRRTRKEPCTLTILPSYGHLDVFLGRDAVRDTFPRLLSALES
jgi:pimeloyl-ACP methyl ester carboxylesterase